MIYHIVTEVDLSVGSCVCYLVVQPELMTAVGKYNLVKSRNIVGSMGSAVEPTGPCKMSAFSQSGALI